MPVGFFSGKIVGPNLQTQSTNLRIYIRAVADLVFAFRGSAGEGLVGS